MKNLKFIYTKNTLFLALIFIVTVSCERDLSDEVEFATLGNTAEVFTDSPIGLGSDFYFPFLGSKLTAWTVDDNEGYESQSSMRIDVPNANDPEGNYAGAIFRVDGAGRDLTGYDALTFWAKASQGVNIGELGFGQDFLENKYQVTIQNTSFGTNWTKYIIPIPDPSKLFDERGMFWYSAGTQETGGFGYAFWIDDLKFEKLGTIGIPRPKIYEGGDVNSQGFLDTSGVVETPSVTFNLPSGVDQTVTAASSYFDWTSSEPSIVAVRDFGEFEMISIGTSVITASLAGEQATGSLSVEVLGEFNFAPTPTQDPADVISIFSDAYTNVPVDFYNGFWEPYQTTLSADFVIGGDNILSYTDFNFVGNQFANPTVDATNISNLHVDMFIPNELPSLFDFLISVVDFGADGVDGGGDDTRQQIFVTASDVEAGTWISFDFPITLANRDHLGLIIYENINFATLSNFYLDNIYFY
jgi:hypothetical protein